MAFPFQTLVARSDSAQSWTLYGASGTKLVAQSSDGMTSTWPTEDDQVRAEEDDQERPGKRIKLSPQIPSQKSNFTHMVLSSDGKYLVAITGEDKCVRVFDIESSLTQLSERCMPRRPSAIVLTSDDSTILCADKFGDVYALPLLPGPQDVNIPTPVIEEPEPEPEPQQDYTPAATVLTVHSGRNRKTLEDQLKRKAKAPKTREIATFKHELLLGHVSMLTDLAYAKVDNRSYIITADRDEHIRISRGQPQAHIIEGFCFGHEEFVSRLCLTTSGLLVSGGGDADLYVWDWQNYKLQNKLLLRDLVLEHTQSRRELNFRGADAANFKVAVSGLWQTPSQVSVSKQIITACEGVPALFALDIDGTSSGTMLPLRGNVLDVAFVQAQDSWTLIVSIDNVYKPGSTTELQDDQTIPRLQYFSKQPNGQWREDDSLASKLQWFVHQGSEVQTETKGDSKDAKGVRDILYSVGNLRKRPGADAED